MTNSFSIAEARDKFATIVHAVEENADGIAVTRRGKPVAVLISAERYQTLLAHEAKGGFWQAYELFREKFESYDTDFDSDWADVRSKETGRETTAWD